MRILTARYNGTCAGCGTDIRKGERIAYDRRKRETYHASCAPSGDPQADQEYWQGRAEGARYSAERKIYGDALAERFAMEDDLARYNRGEDD